MEFLVVGKFTGMINKLENSFPDAMEFFWLRNLGVWLISWKIVFPLLWNFSGW